MFDWEQAVEYGLAPMAGFMGGTAERRQSEQQSEEEARNILMKSMLSQGYQPPPGYMEEQGMGDWQQQEQTGLPPGMYIKSISEGPKGKTVQFAPLETKEKEKPSPLEKDIRGYQKKAAGQGWGLEVQGTPEARLRAARSLYAAKMGTKPPKAWTPTTVDRTLGALKAGGYVEKLTGRPYEFRGREEAENYLLSTLGPDWASRVPEALKILNEKWPGETAEKDDWWNE